MCILFCGSMLHPQSTCVYRFFIHGISRNQEYCFFMVPVHRKRAVGTYATTCMSSNKGTEVRRSLQAWGGVGVKWLGSKPTQVRWLNILVNKSTGYLLKYKTNQAGELWRSIWVDPIIGRTHLPTNNTSQPACWNNAQEWQDNATQLGGPSGVCPHHLEVWIPWLPQPGHSA